MQKKFTFDIPTEDFPRKTSPGAEPLSVQTRSVSTFDDEDLKMTLAIRTSEASAPGAFVNNNSNDYHRHGHNNQDRSNKPSVAQSSNIIQMKQMQRSRGERDTPCRLHVDEEDAIDDLHNRMNNFQVETNLKVAKEDSDLAKRHRRGIIGCGIIVLIAILVSVLSIVLVVLSRRRTKYEDASPTAQPRTQVDLEDCYTRPISEQSARFRSLRSILVSQVPEEAEVIDTAWSTARAALCWLAEADDFMIADIEGNEYYILQRFSLACIYYKFVGINAPKSKLQPLTVSGWLSETSSCQWKGLACSGDDPGVVSVIDLNEMILVASSIPTELTFLTDVAFLSSKGNKIIGVIPSEISRLAKLTHLSFNENLLTGTIPSEVFALPELTELDLNSNYLTGTIPENMGEATNLQRVTLSRNLLAEGMIPDLSKLTSLIALGMTESGGIHGLFPNLSGSSNLEYLLFENVVLSGTIPSYLWTFSNLSDLTLRVDKLSGSIPTIIGELSKLSFLSLRMNALSGSIPTEIGRLSRLTTLDLTYCQSLTGSIPSEIGLLSQLEFLSVTNLLSGTFPTEVCSFQNLSTFYGGCDLCSCCKGCGLSI